MLHPQLKVVSLAQTQGNLLVIQDDLLHPVLGGNKLRKLDALLPEIKTLQCTDLARPHFLLISVGMYGSHVPGSDMRMSECWWQRACS